MILSRTYKFTRETLKRSKHRPDIILNRNRLAEIRQLRVGNTVSLKREIFELQVGFVLKCHKPVLLDHELLAAVGFVAGEVRLNGFIYKVELLKNRKATYQFSRNGHYKTVIRYIHELQNIFLALSRQELLEIVYSEDETVQLLGRLGGHVDHAN